MIDQAQLDPAYLQLIHAILKQTLPPHAKVWLFGSRATGKAKKFSDIDLLIDIGIPLSPSLSTKLNLAFDESILPYKVDIADALSISEDFKNAIKSQLITIPL